MRVQLLRLAITGVAVLASGGALASPAAAASQLELSASSTAIWSGQRVTLSVTLAAPAPGATLQLTEAPYPYRAALPVEAVTLGTGQTYSYAVAPHIDTRYRATVSGGPSGSESAELMVGVRARTVTLTRALTLGRAEITLIMFHPARLHWNRVAVRWSFAEGQGRFLLVARSLTRRLGAYATLTRAVVRMGPGPYRFRACLDPPGADALLNPRRPPGCHGRGYHGGGALPFGFPGPVAIARAERYLRGRGGRTGLAVIDSEDRLSGLNLDTRFITGSVVKAMLLVAYLRRLASLGQHSIDPYSASFLYPMIHVSDNNAASETMRYVGAAGLYALARAAGMTNFYVAGSAPGDWGTALLTPADQAHFFYAIDSLIPREFVGYARFLLSTIAPYESWGIPAVARALGYRVFFKGGWRPSPDVYLVNQIARLEGHGRIFAIAIMTDGDPGMGYGIQTLQGVARALLG